MIVAGVFLASLLGAAAVFQNDAVRMSFDDDGRLSSLRETVSGRELVAAAVPMVAVTRTDGVRLEPSRFTADGNRLTYGFPADAGEVTLSVTPFAGGWTFTVCACSVKDVKDLTFARVMPSCAKWEGDFVNGMSDETSGVILRAYDLQTEMCCNGSMGLSSYASNSGVFPTRDNLGLRLTCEMPERGLVGLRGGLIAGPRESILPALKAMTIAAGIPSTACGGAWSLGSDDVRRSYLFADLAAAATDDWIELARRGGLGTIHLHMWWQWLGHYFPRKEFFPGGLDEMKRVVGRIHAAGLKAGIHTLTGSIDPEFDPWIRPVPRTDLLSVASYTLARPLTADATELYVNEIPVERHDFVYTYRSSGNTLKIGDELIDYTGLEREKPYRFTGLKRGTFGTRAAAHAAGERCAYLRQRYLAFYPDPEKPLVRELAGCISNVYATCGLNQIYFDGSEGSGTRWATDLTRRTLFSFIDQSNGPVLVEGSCRGPHNWWFMSRYGACDLPFWGAKRFHDRHIRNVIELGCKANFLAPQFGWWSPRAPSAEGRGFFVDETEYFAGKNAGWDAASSIIGADVTKGPLAWGQLRQMTVNGWYERPRLARAFRPEIREQLRRARAEYRLRQGVDGIWRLSPVEMNVHRVADAFSRRWRIKSATERPAAIRIEALTAPVDEDYASAPTLIAAADLGTFTATARAVRTFSFPAPYRDLEGRTGFGLKVKGDGSGALFNIQLVGTREYGRSLSEHYVKLDFTGWRYFSFVERERDARLADDHDWPYDTFDQVCGTPLDTNHLGGVSFWLNDIPVGKSATVEISDLRLLRESFPELKGAELTLNGKRLPLPFALKAGEYAELEDGFWTKYDAAGEPLARQAARQPSLKAGENELSFVGGRAEVSVTALSRGEPAFVSPLTDKIRAGMDYEACAPYYFAPAKGFDAPLTVAIRPNELARIRVATVSVDAGVAVKSVELTNAQGRTLTLSVPGQTEPLSGSLTLRPLNPSADAKIDVVKLYEEEK